MWFEKCLYICAGLLKGLYLPCLYEGFCLFVCLGGGVFQRLCNPANSLLSFYRQDLKGKGSPQSHRVIGRVGQEPKPVTEETRGLSVRLLGKRR